MHSGFIRAKASGSVSWREGLAGLRSAVLNISLAVLCFTLYLTDLRCGAFPEASFVVTVLTVTYPTDRHLQQRATDSPGFELEEN